MSWEEATKIWAELTGPDDGFYLSLQVRIEFPSESYQECLFFVLIFMASGFSFSFSFPFRDRSHNVLLAVLENCC